MPDGMKDEGNKKKKCYTWRHRCAVDDEYQVYATSRKDALDVAISRLENGDSPDDSRVIQDTWTLMEVEDD